MNRIIGIVAAVVVLAGGYWFLTAKETPTTPVDTTQGDTSGDADGIDTSGIVEMTMGPADAKVTIIEYASFTCPHCANFHKGPFKQLKADYIDTGKIHFIYRDVYFDRLGLWASMVARCDGTNRFFGISDMLYVQQRDWIGGGDDPVEVANNLRRIGKVAGLSEDQLNACLEDGDKARALSAWYQNNAEADGVNSTPTLMINGEKHGNMNYASLSALIDEKLAE